MEKKNNIEKKPKISEGKVKNGELSIKMINLEKRDLFDKQRNMDIIDIQSQGNRQINLISITPSKITKISSNLSSNNLFLLWINLIEDPKNSEIDGIIPSEQSKKLFLMNTVL